jgi:hypothetical protein
MVVCTACASGGGGGAPGTERGSSTRIIEAEILRLADSVNSAWEVVQRLRPQWLRSRGQVSVMSGEGDRPIVYVNNARFGEMIVLQNIEALSVREMRFIRAADATTRWGTGHPAGAIEVFLHTGSR